MMDDDLYCNMVEVKVIAYLARCGLDDFSLGLKDFGDVVGDTLHQAFQEFCDEYDDSNIT